jgi:hypothetical protein
MEIRTEMDRWIEMEMGTEIKMGDRNGVVGDR